MTVGIYESAQSLSECQSELNESGAESGVNLRREKRHSSLFFSSEMESMISLFPFDSAQ